MLQDGLYDFVNVKDIIEPCFKSEKELCNFIEVNIEQFCGELGFEYKSHTREAPLFNFKKRFQGSKRIDFLIVTKCGQRLGIECKHPHYISELAAGIGQILSYITISSSINHHYLVSSKIDLIVPLMLEQFKLPISFIVMDKTKMLTWQRQQEISTL